MKHDYTKPAIPPKRNHVRGMTPLQRQCHQAAAERARKDAQKAVDLLADANGKIILLERDLAETTRTLKQLEDWVRAIGHEPAFAYDQSPNENTLEERDRDDHRS
jgi:hypothetical protein